MSQERMQRVVANMKRMGLRQIVVASASALYYLAGVRQESAERLIALYLSDDGECVLFANKLFGARPQSGVRLEEHPDGGNPLAGMARIVRPGKLGIDEKWASKFLISLCEQRPDVQPVLGSLPVLEARMIKDEQELEALRAASRINDEAMALLVAAIGEGATETAIADRLAVFFKQNRAQDPGFGIVAFGANGADPHHFPDETVVKPGDSIVLDIGAPFHDYWCDMTRTVFFQTADEEHRRVYDAVLKANLAGIEAVRPGLPLRVFDEAARQVIEDAGYGPYFTHRLGHGIGMDEHEFPFVDATTEVLAQPGMVFSVEPGIYLPDKLGVRIEDLVIVTEDGCENLNAYTKELQVIG